MISRILQDTGDKMRKSLEVLEKELASIRTGRAAPGLVEHIKVEYAGVPTPLNQLGGISVAGARLLVIQPWDRNSIPAIEKAILKSDLGLTPTNDGTIIRLNVPPLTEERRHELVRMLRRLVEEGRVAIRNLRREAAEDLKDLEKKKELSQDEHKRAMDQLQKLTDSFIADVEQAGRVKETEVMEV
ncbi:MAG: ribosome recycling factor [Chloroflexi bacterium]|nr:ribosome recycling factor [Chloroflexota bacterium]